MADSISQILRKKYPDGCDLGRLFVETTVKDIECWKDNKPIKHAYTQQMLDEAYNKLPPQEKKIFGLYSDIHDTLLAIYDRNEAYLQEFYNGYYRIKYTLDELMRNEVYEEESLRFMYFLKEDQIEEFKKQNSEKLLLVSNFKKSGRFKELKEAYSLVNDALTDFSCCKEYLDILGSIYDFNFSKLCKMFLSEAASKVGEIDCLIEEIKPLNYDVTKIFKNIDVEFFKHDWQEDGSERASSLWCEWCLSNTVHTRAEANSFAKRFKVHIKEIKDELEADRKRLEKIHRR